ncbi:phosphoethanolamine transferase [Gammaproteobacteria bacterium]|nr:phosphoethanolamine transferase [Gammaproteobacteria bacterium]
MYQVVYPFYTQEKKRPLWRCLLDELIAFTPFWLPVLLTLVVMPFNLFNIKGIVVDVFTALLLYLFIRLFKKGQVQTFIYSILSASVLIVSTIDLVLTRLYGQKPSVDDCYVVFQTNVDNGIDYLEVINHWYVYLLMFLFLCLYIWTIRFFHKHQRLTWKPLLPLGHTLVWILLFVSTLPLLHKLRMHSSPYILYYSYQEFSDYNKVMQGVYSNPLGGDFNNVQSLTNDTVTCIIIVGESQGTHRMGLYGYSRKNTPLLAARNDIYIFDSIVSPFATTSAVLSRVFTQTNADNPDKVFDGSIMQLANQAGFKTYYLSNQKAIGLSANMVTVMANGCDEVFFNKNAQQTDYQNTAINHYDIDLIPELQNALNDTASKKLIFLHLMGCHAKYTSRYPESFNKYSGEVETPFPSKGVYHAINSYDNALLYSDWFINTVIEETKQKVSKNTSVLWFSDHGEEVYESIFLEGHSSHNVTKAMLDIPLIIWSNNTKMAKFDPSQRINRPQCSDDLFYTFCDLMNIHYQQFDSTRSVINQNYQKRPIVVLGSQSYKNMNK